MADDFLTTYAPLANDIADRTGLHPATVLGIIDTETGHGARVSGNNIFGISPVGPDGRQVVAGYPDVQTAAQSFVRLMQTPRYAGVSTVNDPAAQAAMLVKGGYNTVNPKYATTVASNAQNAVKQLGYQGDQGQGGGDSSQPTPDYNNPTPTPTPPSAKAPASPTDQLIQELQKPDGGTQQPQTKDAQPKSATDQLIEELQKPSTGGFTGPPAKTAAPPLESQGDNPMGDQGGSGGSAMPPANPPAPYGGLPIFPAPAPGAVGRIIEAGREGATNTPDASGWAPAGVELGRYIVNPLLQAGGAAVRGGQQFLQEAISPIDPRLGRDVAGAVEAFPTGVDLPMEPPSALAARNALSRTTPFSAQRPISVQEITDAIRRSDANALIPGEPPAPSAGVGAGPKPPTPPEGGAAPSTEQAAPMATDRAYPPSEIRKGQLRDLGYSDDAIGKMTQRDADFIVSGKPEEVQQPPPTGQARQSDPGRDWRPVQSDEVFQPGRQFRMNQTTGVSEVYDPQPQTAAKPQPAAAGAEATTEPIPEPTREQTATNIRKDVGQTAKDRAGPGLRDDNAYFENPPGAPPLPERPDAFRDFSPQRALDHEYYYSKDPEYRADIDAINTARHSDMTDWLKDAIGDDNTIKASKDIRSEVTPEKMGVFTDEKPVDPALLEDYRKHFEQTLGRFEKRDNIRPILQGAYNKLFDKEGNIETLPSRLQQVRDNMTDWLELKGGTTDASKAVRTAQGTLTDLVDRLNPVMDSGAPKWSLWRQKWTELSRPINRQEFLQNYDVGRPKSLWDKNGRIQPFKVEKLLSDVANAHSDYAVHDAHSLTANDIQKIVDIRNEVATEAFTQSQSKLAHSPTARLMERAAKEGGTTLGAIARMAVDTTAHGIGAVAASHGVPFVNAAYGMYQGTRPIREMRKATKRAAELEEQSNALKQSLLSQKGPPNPLQPP
jgi:hypothetical protein